MLERKELEKLGPPGFHPSQKEKDYVQHWLLSFLSGSGFTGVFKGGTCLQKAYGLARYSEDLDFTLMDGEEVNYEGATAFLSSAGFSGIQWKVNEIDISTTARIRYRGPLYNGRSVSEGVVVLEMSKREKVLLKPNALVVKPPYSDLLPYETLAMDKDEIASEKIRALLTRKSARDLFDLDFLLALGAKLRMELVEQKMKYYGIAYKSTHLEKKIDALAGEWEKEMKALTPAKASYGDAKERVLAEAKKQLV